MISLYLLTFFATANVCFSCTNIIVSKGASTDSSTMVAYNADSAALYGSLYHYPARDHDAGSTRRIYEWDTGNYLGEIAEVEHTYNVVGNVNEYGLVIGETTYGGIASLQHQPDAIMDYGSLIWVTLQRAQTAREAIKTLDDLMTKYGYYSEGESFSIADPNETWVMELIGKGEFERGAVWVARRVPDGYVCGHANQARITTFPLDDADTALYSHDVISFARDIGLYEGSDEEFSFSDVYDPITFDGARFCEARVWSFFGALMGEEWAAQYLDYAQGYNLTNRMPLYVQPPAKVSLQDTIAYMRNHYEASPLDMTGNEFSDVGAGYAGVPYRWRPLSWTVEGSPALYFNERAIGTQQTGWNFVAQSRSWMPHGFAALLWFGVDDSATTVHFPIHGGATRIPAKFAGAGAQDGVTAPMMTFSMDAAFSVFNLVANWAYARYNLIYPDVLTAVLVAEIKYIKEMAEVDSTVKTMCMNGQNDEALEYATTYSENTGNALVVQWGAFFGELFVKYRDGYVITTDPTENSCGCNVANSGYGEKWYSRIIEDTGDHYKYPEANIKASVKDPKLLPVPKLSLKNGLLF